MIEGYVLGVIHLVALGFAFRWFVKCVTSEESDTFEKTFVAIITLTWLVVVAYQWHTLLNQ